MNKLPLENTATLKTRVVSIAQDVENGFQREEHIVAVWVDIEKTFNKVWNDALLYKLAK